jgi:PKHD-type hydroxylase
MIVNLPGILDAAQVAQARRALEGAEWVDGKVTAGHQSAAAKRNQQVAERDPVALELGKLIVQRLSANPLFLSAALPLHIFPPLFNRYAGGQEFGTHVDNAVRTHQPSGMRIRTDLSATLFLSEPDEYEGGELAIEDLYGVQRVRLPAGHMVLYPASSLHHVTPVTRGARIAGFFWIQSMVRDDGERTLLFDLDRAAQQIGAELPGSAVAVQLAGVYHNLLRRWADT